MKTHFGRVEAVILDFYHAAEHLAELGRALHPSDEDDRARLLGDWCRRLEQRGGAAVLEGLSELEVCGRAARDVWPGGVRYFANQSHRMDYPTYVAKGWAIGSGPVEAACKTIAGQRMKGAGMRWGEHGTDAMSHLRALFKSGDGQWDAYRRIAA